MMTSTTLPINSRNRNERGSILIMTAISMIFLFLMVGLAIDVSRFYMLRAELQNAADAAALTAARELNGGTGGISDAVTRVGNGGIVNTQGFGKAGVTISTIEFAVNLDGPYWQQGSDTTANAANIRFVRVTTQTVSKGVFFASAALGGTHVESATATAGMSVGLSGICDFFPAAIALATPSPSPGALMTLKFTQGTGSGANLVDRQFIILEVNEINGNGTGETATLSAGLPNFCKNTGDPIHFTPSSNPNNGPRNSGDGINTRFNVYANGYGNALQPGPFPPDSNVKENISAADYKNRTAGQVTAPNPNAPGEDDRRLLIMPIVGEGQYATYTGTILGWGVFFLRAKVPVPNGNCSATPGCGDVLVEYVGKANVGNAYGVPTAGASLTIPVLYR